MCQIFWYQLLLVTCGIKTTSVYPIYLFILLIWSSYYLAWVYISILSANSPENIFGQILTFSSKKLFAYVYD